MSIRTIARNAALAGAAAAVIAGAGAGVANAATVHTHGVTTAVTRITNRYDGGGAGNWAYDTFGRTLTIDYLGHVTAAQIAADPALAATPYEFDATLTDAGTFKDIPGALTPNQGGHDAGRVLGPDQVTGTMTGTGQFGLFYASARPNSARTFANSGVPIRLRGPVQNALYPSYTWPELAFPSATTFADLNESGFAYYYHVPAETVTSVRWVHGHKVTTHRTLRAQNWADTAWNADGQAPGDGNITGR
jgi:hypothetical protein